MEVRTYQEGDIKLTNIKTHIEDERVTISFKWPNELEQVYIYKRNLLVQEAVDFDRPFRKYTKNEYVCFGGFVDQQVGLGVMEYWICPYFKEAEEGYILDFPDNSNKIKVMTKKIAINYQLNEKKKLFSRTKLVQMHIFCEMDLPRETLCYVKKKGSIPVNSQDGMQFKFIEDFVAGDNILPEIEIDKEEYLRIYLSDEVEYKEIYGVYKL